jgi:hypothetical protein
MNELTVRRISAGVYELYDGPLKKVIVESRFSGKQRRWFATSLRTNLSGKQFFSGTDTFRSLEEAIAHYNRIRRPRG